MYTKSSQKLQTRIHSSKLPLYVPSFLIAHLPINSRLQDQAVKVSEAYDLEQEVNRLRSENADLRKRVSDVSSLENAKKKAEGKVEQLENKMEDLIAEKVGQKEAELNATYDERLRNYEEREQDLQRQVSLTKAQLRDLRTSNESNQAKLLDHSQRQGVLSVCLIHYWTHRRYVDQEVVGKLAEVDMIVADLERANSRVATVERRNVCPFLIFLFLSLFVHTRNCSEPKWSPSAQAPPPIHLHPLSV